MTNPEDYIVIMDDPVHNFGGGQFYLKNGKFTAEEVEVFQPYIDANQVLYAPAIFNVKHADYEKYRTLIASLDGWKSYEKTGINCSTDFVGRWWNIDHQRCLLSRHAAQRIEWHNGLLAMPYAPELQRLARSE